MDNTKESVLRVLDAAKARCAQAVLDGNLTVQEYEKATGESGNQLLKQVTASVKMNFRVAKAALRDQGRAAVQKAYDSLTAAGVEEEEIMAILGTVVVKDGVVTVPDWDKLLADEG